MYFYVVDWFDRGPVSTENFQEHAICNENNFLPDKQYRRY